MDLLSTIRKSGSRGGVNFSWDDVAKSSRRENYLGHSLKAPVGRWQTGKDLNWYSKSDDPTAEDAKEQLRKDELRKIKEAEEDAIARALGLPPPVRESSGANAIEVKPRDRDMDGQGTKEDEVDNTTTTPASIKRTNPTLRNQGTTVTAETDTNTGAVAIGVEVGAGVEALSGALGSITIGLVAETDMPATEIGVGTHMIAGRSRGVTGVLEAKSLNMAGTALSISNTSFIEFFCST
ncbi:Multiple myeloma tumor-associated protein 2 [Ceratocystis lukuohia]|uniref:Multiple myeloma tumor-associated protein 2 n=1 Tax=Ceratocystis lukuohia TaxID=2019550 RepID=A0ABR4MM39_9PEZI